MTKFAAFVLCCVSFHAAGALGEEKDEKLAVGASIRPMALALEAVGEDALSVRTILGAKSDPHATELSPSTVRAAAEARVIFSYSHVEINERLAALETPLHVIGAREPAHQWLDIGAQKRDLLEIAEALCGLRPGLCGRFRDRAARIAVSLDVMGKQCRESLSPFADVFVAGTHPAWEAFLRSAGFRRTSTLLTRRDESLVPSALSNLRAVRGQSKRMIFIADPDTSDGVEALLKTDFSADVVVLDESGMDAQSLEGFYERLCRNLKSALER